MRCLQYPNILLFLTIVGLVWFPDFVVGVQPEQPKRAPADDLDGPPFVTCKAWLIGDPATGKILASHDAQKRLHPASTTKVMTAYIVCRLAQANPEVLDEIVTFSERADRTTGSTSGIKAGESLPVRELLRGMMLPSGNDASVALGEHFGARFPNPQPDMEPDTLELFITEMNRTAKKLGMKDTTYANTHGLTHAEHLSTASDLFKLTTEALKIPLFRELVGTRRHSTTLKGTDGTERKVSWTNTNQLLGINSYFGVKTGTTNAAGACLISAGRREGVERVVVVLGSAVSAARYTDTQNLFRWSWRIHTQD